MRRKLYRLTVQAMQSTDLTASYFELFGLPAGFDIDGKALMERYRELQRAVHPDKFANASDAERRLSVQVASRVNEGYRTLKDPLARARYLLELKGVDLNDTDTALDGGFLMEQMELRERLEEAKGAADSPQRLQKLGDDIRGHEDALVAELQKLFDNGDAQALAKARDASRKLQFFRRLADELIGLEDDLALS